MMVKCDIPLNKVNSFIFKQFMHKYTGHNIPERKALDKYISSLYDNTIEKIKEEIKDKNIYLIVDETSDKNHRNVLNIMVGVLDGNPKKSMLIISKFVTVAYHTTVMQSVNDACVLLWPNGIQYNKLLLIVSDQAKYMLKAMEGLKNYFPKLNHVSCLAHA
jgi:hypothetical protein